jgi:hypothetical protein
MSKYFLETTVRQMTLKIVSGCYVSSSGDYQIEIKYWKADKKGATVRTFHLNEDMFMLNGPELGWWKAAPAYMVKAAKNLVADSIRAGLPFYENTVANTKRVTRYPSTSEEMRYYSDEFVGHWLKRVEEEN